jgi:D-glycero-D-manno-heptose 1,7-bisphosphate phosphatase
MKAVFLDRDGVLNASVVRNGSPYPPQTLEEFQLYPEVYEACASLRAAGYLLVVVTNQPDVGRGTQAQEVVESMHAFLQGELSLDRIEVCYDPGGTEPPCEDRKPRPGMVLRAARELDIDLDQSFLVGDRWRDIDCALAAGCRAVFIDRGYDEALRGQPHHRCAHLGEAAQWILSVEPTLPKT